jgi:hypothetical protein
MNAVSRVATVRLSQSWVWVIQLAAAVYVGLLSRRLLG